MSEATPKKEESKGTLPPLGQLWQIPAVLVALITFAVAAYIARHPVVSPATIDGDLAALRLAFESGNVVAGVTSAQRFLARYPSSRAVPFAHFVMACGKWAITEPISTATRNDLNGCLSLFRKASAFGLPPAYEAQALRSEGDILLRLDQASDAADAYLSLLGKYPLERAVLPDLAIAYTRMKPANLEKARELIGVLLSTERLSPADLQRGYLAKAQIELSAKDFAAAIVSSQQVLDSKPGPEVAAQAALVVGQALAGQGDYAGALKSLGKADAAAGRFEGSIYLARAVYLWKTGASGEALKAFEETVFRFPGTAVSLSARYELARFFFESGQIDAARDALHNLLDDMSLQQVDETDVFDIYQVADLWFSVGRAILEQKGYKAVRNVHAAASKLMPRGEFLFFDATLYLREAEQREVLLPGLPSQQQEAARAEIKQLYHQAGAAFSRVLEATSPRFFSRALFGAGHAFWKSGDYVMAVLFLRQYAAQNIKNADVPRALIEEAGALAELGDYEAAIRVCMENARIHPTNIYAYQAILLQADLYFELGGQNIRHAAEGYQGILTDRRFEASSSEWRSAVFSLGKALYLMGDYKGAVLKLDEALARFKDDPRATEAQYYLGLASRQVAFGDEALKESPLVQAAAIFARLASAENPYSAAAAFLEADCYYDLGDYSKALALYDRAVETHVDTPDATRALFQMANCYHRLGRTREADATYKRALFNLNRQREVPAPGGDFYKSVAQWRSKNEV